MTNTNVAYAHHTRHNAHWLLASSIKIEDWHWHWHWHCCACGCGYKSKIKIKIKIHICKCKCKCRQSPHATWDKSPCAMWPVGRLLAFSRALATCRLVRRCVLVLVLVLSRWRWCWQCGFVFGVSQRQYAYVVKFKSSTPLRQLQLNHSMSIARSR